MKRTNDAWAARDRKVVWHPFTQMKDWAKEPVTVIERSRGNTLIDTEGREYLDGVSSLWANVHGHRVPEIDRAVKAQLGRIAHSTFLGLSHPPAIELSEKLIRLAPQGLSRVFYSDSGAASVEVALKMAFQYCQLRGLRKKKTFLRLQNAYHGDTMGAVSVGGIGLFHRIFGALTFKSYEAPAPYAYRDRFKGSEKEYAAYMAGKVEAVLKKRHKEICALVWEPVMQGAAGMLKQPAGYGARLRKLTKKYGVLLIADEVATGFGRTGKMFACEHENVSPDFLCLAKGITAGYLPLSATLTTEEIYRAFLGEYKEFKAFFHGHTYSANPLACAAALANLRVFEKEKTLPKLRPKIAYLKSQLDAMKDLPHVGDIRQAGFMVGIELVEDKGTKRPYDPSKKIGARVGFAARKKGVFIRPLGNVVVLMPPLSITMPELKRLCRVTRACIPEATGRFDA
jgi:adenosylmethionine---8-amino-7-oxononanoate aminotransferase